MEVGDYLMKNCYRFQSTPRGGCLNIVDRSTRLETDRKVLPGLAPLKATVEETVSPVDSRLGLDGFAPMKATVETVSK